MRVSRILGIVTLVLLVFSCSSDDDSGSDNSSEIIAAIRNISASGSWTITSFIDSGSNETNHFNGYSFTFGANGNLTATNGQTTVSGSWSVTSSNSGDDDYDDSYNDIDFNIFFASPDAFEELSDDWHIITYSNTSIQLIDVSGGNGGTDYLTFTKN